MSRYTTLRFAVERAHLNMVRQSAAEHVFEAHLLVTAIAKNRKIVGDLPTEQAAHLRRVTRTMESIVRFRARCLIDAAHQQAEASGADANLEVG